MPENDTTAPNLATNARVILKHCSLLITTLTYNNQILTPPTCKFLNFFI